MIFTTDYTDSHRLKKNKKARFAWICKPCLFIFILMEEWLLQIQVVNFIQFVSLKLCESV